MPLFGIEPFGESQKGSFFFGSFRVSAVHGEAEKAVFFQHAKAGADGCQSGSLPGGQALVAAGKIAQIKNDGGGEALRAFGPGQVSVDFGPALAAEEVRHAFVAQTGEDAGRPCGAYGRSAREDRDPLIFQKGAGGFDRLRLQVESVQDTGPHLGQTQSIVAIAAGGIDDDVSRPDIGADDMHGKFCCSLDQITHDWIMARRGDSCQCGPGRGPNPALRIYVICLG